MQKLFNFPASEWSGVDVFSLMGLAVVLESVGCILVILGLFIRPVSFVLSSFMMFTYWMAMS